MTSPHDTAGQNVQASEHSHHSRGCETRLERGGLPALHLSGAGHGAPVSLFIHGFGDGGYIWNEVAPSIAGHRRWIAPDLRGHGHSGWGVAGDYRVATYVDDLQDVMAQVGATRWILIGHSMGAEIALALASRSARTVAAVVLADFSPAANTAIVARVRDNFREAVGRRFASKEVFRQHIEATLPLAAPTSIANIVEHALLAAPGGGFMLMCDPGIAQGIGNLDPAAADARSARLWSELRALPMPVLIARGIGSAVLGEAVAVQMAREALAHGTLTTLPVAGHAVMADNPAAFVGAVRRFLQGLGLIDDAVS